MKSTYVQLWHFDIIIGLTTLGPGQHTDESSLASTILSQQHQNLRLDKMASIYCQLEFSCFLNTNRALYLPIALP